MLALARYEAKVCECGFHESLTSDAANHFTFDVRTCPVCRGAARFARMQHEADEQHRKSLGEKVPPSTPDPADGRRMFTRLMGPDEVEQRRSSRDGRATGREEPKGR